MSSPDLPAYEQVKAFVRQRIASGEWRSGDRVPSEAALMRQFGISRMTANRAICELAVEGMVDRVQGSGTRVAELHRILSRLAIRDIREEVVERGHVLGTEVVLLVEEEASTGVARSLGLSLREHVYHSVLVHSENGVPIQYEDRYVNPVAAPGYLQADLTLTSPTAYLLRHAPLTEASYEIEACLPTAAEARRLGITRASPCLAMMRRTISGANVASVARLLYPGARYSFAGRFQV